MNKPINIYEAKTQFSRLVDRASKGESFVIAKAGTPVARLVPIDKLPKAVRIGALEGKLRIPDALFEPMADEIATLFDGVEPS